MDAREILTNLKASKITYGEMCEELGCTRQVIWTIMKGEYSKRVAPMIERVGYNEIMHNIAKRRLRNAVTSYAKFAPEDWKDDLLYDIIPTLEDFISTQKADG